MTDIVDRADSVVAGLFLAGVALLPIMQVRVDTGGVELIPIGVARAGVIIADIALVMAGGAALVVMIAGRIRLKRTLFVAALAAYGAALLVALLAGGVTRTTLSGAATGGYVAGLAALAYHLVPERVSPIRFLKAFVMGTVIATGAALAGVVLFYVGLDLPSENRFVGAYGNIPSGPYPRIIGTFLSPNLLCNFLVCGLVVVLTAGHLRVIPRRFAVVLAAAVLVAVGFTLSPGIGGALLAAGVWLWAFPAIRSHSLRRGALIAGVVGAAAFLVLTVVKLDLDDGLQPSLRVRVWQSASHQFLDNPLVGAGLDENLADVHEYTDELNSDGHNLWLSVAGQMGLAGVAAIGFVIASPFVDAERRRRIWRQPVGRGLTIALLGALVYQGLSMSVEDTRHLWIVLGVLAGLAYERETIAVS